MAGMTTKGMITTRMIMSITDLTRVSTDKAPAEDQRREEQVKGA
jgi:hypothetical protein